MPQVSTAAGGDTGAHASTTPLQRAVVESVGRETFNPQTDGTSPSNQRPSDQRTAATKAAGGEQQAVPTEKQEATIEDLHAKLRSMQEHIDKNSVKEKEAEEKLHMIKAQTMRARAAPLWLPLRSTTHIPVLSTRPSGMPAFATRPARRAAQMRWSRTSTTAVASSSS